MKTRHWGGIGFALLLGALMVGGAAAPVAPIADPNPDGPDRRLGGGRSPPPGDSDDSAGLSPGCPAGPDPRSRHPARSRLRDGKPRRGAGRSARSRRHDRGGPRGRASVAVRPGDVARRPRPDLDHREDPVRGRPVRLTDTRGVIRKDPPGDANGTRSAGRSASGFPGPARTWIETDMAGSPITGMGAMEASPMNSRPATPAFTADRLPGPPGE